MDPVTYAAQLRIAVAASQPRIAPSPPRSPRLDRLVGAEVSRPLNERTIAREAAPTAASRANAEGGSIPMYRNPAEKNAAATGVLVGRMLDVRG